MEPERGIESEAASQIKNYLTETLNERFRKEFVFEPIVVRLRVDQDGDEYLQAYIVFDGDQKLLDPAWTLGLSSRLWPLAQGLGFPGVPIPCFVEKSDWPELEKQLQ